MTIYSSKTLCQTIHSKTRFSVFPCTSTYDHLTIKSNFLQTWWWSIYQGFIVHLSIQSEAHHHAGLGKTDIIHSCNNKNRWVAMSKSIKYQTFFFSFEHIKTTIIIVIHHHTEETILLLPTNTSRSPCVSKELGK